MVQTSKLSSIFILFGLSAFSGIISCLAVKCLVSKLGSSSKFKRAISILNCFSGGVFFATSVLSLLPEARESMMQALEDYDVHLEYPLTELAMGIGFFLILTLEHFAHSCCSNRTPKEKQTVSKSHSEKDADDKNSGKKCVEPSVGYKKRTSRLHDGVVAVDSLCVSSDLEDSSCYDDITYQTYGTIDDSVDKAFASPYSDLQRNSKDPVVREIVFQDSDRILVKQSNVSQDTKHKSTHDALEDVKSSTKEDQSRSKLRGLVLLIALSLHMIFDGLALGLLKDSQKVWELLVALALHKVLVFFTIGVQTLEILTSLKKTVLVVVIFALMSPVGIIIGESINLSDDSVTKDMLSAVLQGIATGTFLYVTFFEILQRELGSDDHDLFKVFTTVIGFALVGATRLLEHEDED